MTKRPKFIIVRWYDHHDECIELSAHRPLDADDLNWDRPMRIVKAAIYYRSDRKA